MTDEVKELLETYAHWYETDLKKVWHPEEMATTYSIYNLHFGTALRDTGCNSCRRSVVTHVRKLYQTMAKNQ